MCCSKLPWAALTFSGLLEVAQGYSRQIQEALGYYSRQMGAIGNVANAEIVLHKLIILNLKKYNKYDESICEQIMITKNIYL